MPPLVDISRSITLDVIDEEAEWPEPGFLPLVSSSELAAGDEPSWLVTRVKLPSEDGNEILKDGILEKLADVLARPLPRSEHAQSVSSSGFRFSKFDNSSRLPDANSGICERDLAKAVTFRLVVGWAKSPGYSLIHRTRRAKVRS